jgi:hypothetical protein
MITNLKQVTKYSNIPGYVERKSQRLLGVELGRPATRNELVEHKKDNPSFQLRKILENRDRERETKKVYLSFRDFLSPFACPRKINHRSIIQSPEIQAIIRIFSFLGSFAKIFSTFFLFSFLFYVKASFLRVVTDHVQ